MDNLNNDRTLYLLGTDGSIGTDVGNNLLDVTDALTDHTVAVYVYTDQSI